jgi:hypothetical protein
MVMQMELLTSDVPDLKPYNRFPAGSQNIKGFLNFSIFVFGLQSNLTKSSYG